MTPAFDGEEFDTEDAALEHLLDSHPFRFIDDVRTIYEDDSEYTWYLDRLATDDEEDQYFELVKIAGRLCVLAVANGH